MPQRHRRWRSKLLSHAGCPQPPASTEKAPKKGELGFPFSFLANDPAVRSPPSFTTDALQRLASCSHHREASGRVIYAPAAANTDAPCKITLRALVKGGGSYHHAAWPHRTSPPGCWPWQLQLQLSEAGCPPHVCSPQHRFRGTTHAAAPSTVPAVIWGGVGRGRG